MLMFHSIQQNSTIDYQFFRKKDLQSIATTDLFAFWKNVGCPRMIDIGLDRGYRVIAIVTR